MREEAVPVRERCLPAVHASWTAAQWARAAAIAGVAGGFMGFAGAFGTGAMPLPLRLAYWVGLMLAGTVLANGIFAILALVRPLARRPLAYLAAATLAMGGLYTGVVWLVTRPLHPVGPLELFAPVLMVSAAMTALNMLANRTPVETHAASPGAPPPRFLDRLPPKLKGAELYAVEAQDHYLRLHTSRGGDLILMRLSDAVAELEGLEGAQTHRSWWVAKDAVESARRADGRAVLVLKSGAEAPVSRSYLRALRAEGWFG